MLMFARSHAVPNRTVYNTWLCLCVLCQVIVGAASILAKVERDAAVRALEQQHNVKVGSGTVDFFYFVKIFIIFICSGFTIFLFF